MADEKQGGGKQRRPASAHGRAREREQSPPSVEQQQAVEPALAPATEVSGEEGTPYLEAASEEVYGAPLAERGAVDTSWCGELDGDDDDADALGGYAVAPMQWAETPGVDAALATPTAPAVGPAALQSANARAVAEALASVDAALAAGDFEAAELHKQLAWEAADTLTIWASQAGADGDLSMRLDDLCLAIDDFDVTSSEAAGLAGFLSIMYLSDVDQQLLLLETQQLDQPLSAAALTFNGMTFLAGGATALFEAWQEDIELGLTWTGLLELVLPVHTPSALQGAYDGTAASLADLAEMLHDPVAALGPVIEIIDQMFRDPSGAAGWELGKSVGGALAGQARALLENGDPAKVAYELGYLVGPMIVDAIVGLLLGAGAGAIFTKLDDIAPLLRGMRRVDGPTPDAPDLHRTGPGAADRPPELPTTGDGPTAAGRAPEVEPTVQEGPRAASRSPDVEPPASGLSKAEERASRAGNYQDLKDDVVGNPPPAEAPEGYRYRYDKSVEPPRMIAIERIDATDTDWAPLTLDPDGKVAFGTKAAAMPDHRAAYVLDEATGKPKPLDTGGASVADEVAQPLLRERSAAIAERDALKASGDAKGAGKAQAKANKATEMLGVEGAKAYMKSRDSGAELVHEGTGSGTFDLVYQMSNPPPEFVVVEAKGGSGANSASRLIGEQRYQQGRQEYAEDILRDMAARGQASDDFAEEMRMALELGELEYIEVTQPMQPDGLAPLSARQYDLGPTE